jgi:murein DD-endopeptidase MepM/ murein hydrolase activator NlpD
MAFVILSTGSITRSRLHTLRASTLLLSSGVVLLLTLAGGLRLGYEFGQTVAAEPTTVSLPEPESLAYYLEQPEGRALIDRIGALSGRLIQLETEAKALAARIGMVQDVEQRIDRTAPQTSAAPAPKSAAVLASPSGPSGGPFVPASGTADPLPSAEVGDEELGIGQIEQDLEELSLTLGLIATANTPRELESMAFPGRLPISGRRISSGFGNRIDPFTRRRARHTGIDIPAPRNTPIAAAGGGRVTFAGYRAAYGNTVEIDHGNGLKTRYAHASRLLVRRGQIVLPNQPIAVVGSSGRSTGAHLHFEVLRDGTPVEPRNYVHPTGA